MLAQSCPVSLKPIDSVLARLNALTVFILTLITIETGSLLLAFILVYDFSIRLASYPQLSLSITFSKIIKKLFNIPIHLMDAAPKRLAAFMGLGFSLFIAVAIFFDISWLFYSMTLFLALGSGLEFFFDYCLGCKIYYIYQSLRWRNQ